MGCDVFDRVSNFSISKIAECLRDSKQKEISLTQSLKDEMKKRMKSLNDNVIDTLIGALMYEPELVDTGKVVKTTQEQATGNHLRLQLEILFD